MPAGFHYRRRLLLSREDRPRNPRPVITIAPLNLLVVVVVSSVAVVVDAADVMSLLRVHPKHSMLAEPERHK